MSNEQRINLGPATSPIQQGRNPHGRWRIAYQQASSESPLAEDQPDPLPVALRLIQDAERLVLALTEGPAAEFLAEQLVQHLWITENANGAWPENLRDWLADTTRWTEAPPGRTGFVCGRIERGVAGGRIYLAWLGLSGVRLYNRADHPVELDTVIVEDEGWTREHGPEPEGMALHAYRGSLFSLERLTMVTTAAQPVLDELPDMANSALQQALEDWAVDAAYDLSFFDLRITPVLNEPNALLVNYQWISPDQVELSWHPSPNATAYRIEEATTSDFADASRLAELTDGRQSHYRLSPPTNDTRYYRVIPLNQGVAGKPSAPVDPTPIMLNPPIMDQVQWANDGGYFLSWSPLRQATSYEVQSAPNNDFSPHDSQIIYRGELPETYLSHNVATGHFYRVRALNSFYAPRTPSPWSNVVQAPVQLPKPVFTNVTQQRLEWEPIVGAQQYIVRVTTRPHKDDQLVEEFILREPGCVVADQHAVYHVRAIRRADDEESASPWSEAITLSPKEGLAGMVPSIASIGWVLGGLALVALLVGVALGWLGGEALDNANATKTPTPFPREIIDMTQEMATKNVRNATALQMTADSFDSETATAAAWTPTPTATNTPNLTQTFEVVFQTGLTATAEQWTPTPTPTNTPNLTETVEMAFQTGLTATAEQWTATPTPTNTPNLTETVAAAFQAGLTATAEQWTPTPTPTNTPNMTRTVAAVFQAGLTATAEQWTPTLTPSFTPDVTQMVEAAFEAGLTATAAQWTETPTPSASPDVLQTAQAAVRAELTATAAGWTQTPTPPNTPNVQETIETAIQVTLTALPTNTSNIPATVDALVLANLGLPADTCVVINQSDAILPVYAEADTASEVLFEDVPQFAQIRERQIIDSAIWLETIVTQPDDQVISGWLLVPADLDETLIYGGDGCPRQ